MSYNIAHWTNSGGWEATDCLNACETADGALIVSSPNMVVIPVPYVGNVDVAWQADGSFGPYDPAYWPQIFDAHGAYRWVTAVRVEPSDVSDEARPMWRPVDIGAGSRDFIAIPGSQLYTVADVFKAPLDPLVKNALARGRAYVEVRGEEHDSVLRHLCDHLKYADQLLSYPSTKRDLVRGVANLQRHWLLLDAWLEWHAYLSKPPGFAWHDPGTTRSRPRGVRVDLMGGFTSDPRLASELYDRNIPVWLLRIDAQITDMTVVKAVCAATDMRFPQVFGCGLFDSRPIYSGPAGSAHFEAVIRSGFTTIDVLAGGVQGSDHAAPWPERRGPPCPQRSTLGATNYHPCEPPLIFSWSLLTFTYTDKNVNRTAQARIIDGVPATPTSKARTQSIAEQSGQKAPKISKHPNDVPKNFDCTPNDMLANPIPPWANALRRVDRSRPAPTTNTWRHWVPKPPLLVGRSNLDRAHSYVAHWLELRDIWFGTLQKTKDTSTLTFTSKEWSDLVDIGLPDDLSPLQKGTHTGTRRLNVLHQYLLLTKRDNNDDVRAGGPWEGKNKANMDEVTAMQVTWEVAEVGFRLELQALDRHLVHDNVAVDRLLSQVFADRPLIPPLPSTTEPPFEGLSALTVAGRRRSLEALRQLLVRWPGADASITPLPLDSERMPDVEVLAHEEAICRFYTQTFWEVCGRAATIPRQFPSKG